MKRIAFAVVTVVLGACAGAFCWAFFFLMNAGLDLLWVKAPAWLAAIGMPAVVYPLAFCVAGGVAIGLFQKNVVMLLNEVVGGGSGLPHFSDMAVGTSELAWALPVVALGACAGWLFHGFGWAVGKLSARLGDRVVVKAVVAGAILGVLGIFLPFTLFAGEAQTEMLAQQWTALGAGALLATGFLKVLASQVCLGLGWRGGHFFPLIFSGIAIGYAAAGLFGIDPVFALSVSTAALLGAAMRQPLMVALLLILCFPAKAVVFVLAAACLGAAVPVPKAFSRKLPH